MPQTQSRAVLARKNLGHCSIRALAPSKNWGQCSICALALSPLLIRSVTCILFALRWGGANSTLTPILRRCRVAFRRVRHRPPFRAARLRRAHVLPQSAAALWGRQENRVHRPRDRGNRVRAGRAGGGVGIGPDIRLGSDIATRVVSHRLRGSVGGACGSSSACTSPRPLRTWKFGGTR